MKGPANATHICSHISSHTHSRCGSGIHSRREGGDDGQTHQHRVLRGLKLSAPRRRSGGRAGAELRGSPRADQGRRRHLRRQAGRRAHLLEEAGRTLSRPRRGRGDDRGADPACRERREIALARRAAARAGRAVARAGTRRDAGAPRRCRQWPSPWRRSRSTPPSCCRSATRSAISPTASRPSSPWRAGRPSESSTTARATPPRRWRRPPPPASPA